MLVQSKWLLGLGGWQTLSICLLLSFGNLDNGLLSFSWGPQPKLKFLNFSIDTWTKYSGFLIWLILDTVINTAGELIIYPWITNEVMDKKTITLSGTYRETLLTSTGYEFYSSVRGIFIIYFSFTQIDFLFIKVVLDTLCQYYVSQTTLKKKLNGESIPLLLSHPPHTLIDVGDSSLSACNS